MLLYLDFTYFRLYMRLTARENNTVGSSIFRKLYLRVFDYLTFILQGLQFCRNYTIWLSKKDFLCFRVRGKAQQSDSPVCFYWKSPWDEVKTNNLLVDVKMFSFCRKETLFQAEFQQYTWKSWSISHR